MKDQLLDLAPRCEQDGRCIPHCQLFDCVQCKYKELIDFQVEFKELYRRFVKIVKFFQCGRGLRSAIYVPYLEREGERSFTYSDERIVDDMLHDLDQVYYNSFFLRELISDDLVSQCYPRKEIVENGNP